jgi:hypothetical protein
MGSPIPSRFLHLRRSAVVLVLLLAAAGCSPGPGRPEPGGAVPPAGPPAPETSTPGPVTAQINQFRDNYSKHIIEIQLTNTTGATVTVLAARLTSPLFAAGVSWASPGGGTELPPGQAKSLPAALPTASCANTAGATAASGEPEAGPTAAVEVRLAPGAGGAPVTVPAADPFGVLPRNNAELCVAQSVARIADLRFRPGLDVSADGRTAFLDLIITPRNPAEPAGDLTIDSVGGTPLLEEDPAAAWPHGLRIDATGPEREVRLGIRPARCDAHAVADDKVGTLIPLRVTVAGREGELKVDAGAQLRGTIYTFVTSACGRQ